MKYLDKAPFSGRANTPEFEKNYDRIKWDRPKKPITKVLCRHGRVVCSVCRRDDGHHDSLS